MASLVYLLIGLALGGVIGWLLRSLRQTAAPADARVENELRQQLAQRESELAHIRDEITQAKAAHASAEARQAAAEKLLTEQRDLHDLAMREAKAARKERWPICETPSKRSAPTR